MHWRNFLTAVVPTNYAAMSEAKNRSGSWFSCACGEQSPKIPRGSCGKPKDTELKSLGQLFCWEVCAMHAQSQCILNGGSVAQDFYFNGFEHKGFEHHRSRALRTLEKIEARAAILLR